MKAGAGNTGAAFIAGSLVVICCAGPLLIAAIGTAELAAWYAKSAYVLIPAGVIGLGLGGLWLYRRCATAENCRKPTAVKKAPNHE